MKVTILTVTDNRSYTYIVGVYTTQKLAEEMYSLLKKIDYVLDNNAHIRDSEAMYTEFTVNQDYVIIENPI